MIHTIFARHRAARSGLFGAITSVFRLGLLLALVMLVSLWSRQAAAAGCTEAITFNSAPLSPATQTFNLPGPYGPCSPNGDIQSTADATAIGSNPGGTGNTIAGKYGTYTLKYDQSGNESITYTPTSTAPSSYTESFTFYGDDGAALYTDTANITINFVSTTTAPDAPTIGTATAGNAQATVTFTAPSSDGGSPITGYTATSSPGGLTGTCSTSPCIVTGLTNGTAYTFTVTATNAIGTSTASGATNSITPSTVPSAPTGVTASGSTPSEATVTFTAANDNGSAITGYTVTSSPAGGVDFNAGSTSLSHRITGLTNGTAYTFTVTATNGDGTGPASSPSNSFTPKALQSITFGNPGSQNFGTTPTLTATASSGLTVSFSSSTTAVCTVTSGGALTFITAGTCTINADQAGSAIYAAASTVTQSFTVAALVPGAPTIGTATPGDAQVSVSFTAPAFTGGASITGYTATSQDGKTGTCAASPCVVTGLTNGTAYTFTVTATNSAGTGGPSAASNSVTPAAGQTITFNNPGAQNFGTSPTLTASANSNLPVSFSSSTTSVCTITAGGALTTVSAGTCTINANQAGDSAYLPAPQVSQSFAITAVVPGAPTIGTATAGNAQATVNFTAPAFTGGASITSYTATANPGGATGTCSASPCVVTGLTNGTAYTFTVTATNSAGTGGPSAASNSVTPKNSQTITFVNPGTKNFGTSPTLSATASSGLTVSFSSSTTSVCTVSGTVLTTVTPGSCTITATQAGNGSFLAAAPVSQTFAIAGVAPGAPTVGTATAGDAQASVTFTAPASDGGNAITGYTATSSPGNVTGGCSSSPCTISGLTNGTAYTFTVTATNAAGTGSPSAASNSVTPKAVGAITNFAANPATPVYKPTGTFTVSATGTGSSSPIVFAVAPSSNAVCSIQSTTVTTLSAGTCTVTANQAGDGSHVAAPQATLAVTINNPPPPTVSNVSANTNYNTATAINLSSAIAGIDVTAVAIAQAPAHGTATLSGQTITYTPSSTFYGGTDTLTYTATNPGGTSSPATVTITVTSAAVPVAVAHTVATTIGTPVLIEASTGATGPKPFVGVSVTTEPTHGSAVANGEQITYTPKAGFIGTDTFTYAVTNHFGNSQPASISVVVTAAGSAAGHTKTVVTAPNTPVSVDLGSIVPGSYIASTLLGLSPGNAGNVSLNQPTALTFTSTGNFLGLVQITAVLTSSSGSSVTVDVLVLVTKQPDPSKNADVLGLINSQTTEAEIFAQSQMDNIRGRLESLHDGGSSLFTNTLSFSLDGRPMQGGGAARHGVPGAQSPDGTSGNDGLWPTSSGFMRPGIGAAEATDGTVAPSNAQSDRHSKTTLKGPEGLGVWIGGTANFGSFDAYRQAAGFDSDNIAVTAGVDQRIGQHSVFGLSIGYNHDNSDISNDGTHSVAQGYSAAVYGSYAPSAQTYIDGVFGGGGLDFSSRRYDGDTGNYLLGRRNGDQWFASLTGGYEYKWRTWLLSPYGRLQWSLSRLNSFSETGDVTGALTYGNELVRTSQTILGMRASGEFKESWGIVIPHVRFEFGHDFQGATNTTLRYAFIPSAGSWDVMTNPYSANGNSLQIGFGSDLQLQHNWLLTTEYDYMTQQHAHDQMIKFGVKKQF